ncbi:hypothetical protein HPSJM_04540 [Helicobacter pylori SJM180]|nr:hypothetical protein HPSJM_04540 [Helicobacter pylori SJM180]
MKLSFFGGFFFKFFFLNSLFFKFLCFLGFDLFLFVDFSLIFQPAF